MIAVITAIVFAATYLLLCLPVFALQRRFSIDLPFAVTGALLGLAPFILTSYLFEGFEFGAVALFRDPMTWLWMAMFMAMCGVAGLGVGRWTLDAGPR